MSQQNRTELKINQMELQQSAIPHNSCEEH